MKSNEKVSVIVPIYNVEKYLERCLKSIINQTYKNLEIILVNDGSPDNSLVICEKYKKQDNRIIILNKKNGGLSSARNEGLKIATGDYISFVDSDDYIEKDMYEILVQNLIENNADISVGGVKDITENIDGSMKITKDTFQGERIIETLSPIDAMKKYLLGSWSAWDKIYKREIHENLYFPEGEINEDEGIALEVLSRAKRVVYDNKSFYNYIKRENSITTSSFNEKKMDWYKHCKNNLKLAQNEFTEVKEEAEFRFLGSILWSFNSMIDVNLDLKVYKKQMLKDIKTLRKSFKVNRHISKKNKIWVEMLNLCSLEGNMKIYESLYKLNKKRRGV